MKKILILIGALCLIPNLFAYEIGDGLGSGYKYPATQFDTNNFPESTGTNWTWQKANDVKEDIVAIEALMGANPQGNYTTVASRLYAVEQATTSGVTNGIFRSSMTEIERINNLQDLNISATAQALTNFISSVSANYVLKVTTGDIYAWNTGTHNVAKQSDSFMVYGSTVVNYNGVSTININGINKILSIMLPVEGGDQGTYFTFLADVYTSSFTWHSYTSDSRTVYWQAIVR